MLADAPDQAPFEKEKYKMPPCTPSPGCRRQDDSDMDTDNKAAPPAPPKKYRVNRYVLPKAQ